ncbi:MAG: nucleoside-triphosphatase [Eubacteriales bacterium]|nr:nucleoside-triphosphatase [Eubacteriales bacterium]
MEHILIVGHQGVGKSTLIGKILNELQLPVCGFVTKKEAQLEDGSCPVYIHSAVGERQYDKSNLIGSCKDFCSTGYPEVFDAHAHLITGAPEGGVMLMDELGVMENKAEIFRAAVMGALDTRQLVVASVRDKNSEFLDAVRAHKKARCFYVTKDSRDKVWEEVLSYIRASKR